MEAINAQRTSAQREAVGDRPAYDITVTSGGKAISDMGGMVTIHFPYALRPGEDPRGLVVYYMDDQGNREWCQTSYDSIRERINYTTDHLSLYVIGCDESRITCDGGEDCPSAPYLDIDTSLWYHEAIDYVIEHGLMGGCGGGLFGPDDPITREQLAVMLWRYAGSPASTNKELHFSDVDESSSWAMDALLWANENGLVNGNGSGVLNPMGQATRAHAAQMLMNFLRSING